MNLWIVSPIIINKKKKSKLDLLGEFEQSTLSKGGRPSSLLAGPEVY